MEAKRGNLNLQRSRHPHLGGSDWLARTCQPIMVLATLAQCLFLPTPIWLAGFYCDHRSLPTTMGLSDTTVVVESRLFVRLAAYIKTQPFAGSSQSARRCWIHLATLRKPHMGMRWSKFLGQLEATAERRTINWLADLLGAVMSELPRSRWCCSNPHGQA